ncbi:MAG: hypothetical protein B7Z61_06275 [Acidobacteria bacterium 37-71-11]|nr:MAG: hypothetical protein B7Z61_06275 [Acidobacteria bacterium 37-71-11]HQT94033.1 S46 family peptidase [Thermoanaerobaculaceae bacterium]
MRALLRILAAALTLAVTAPGRADEGMWMLHQLPELDAHLRAMGLQLSPKQIWDPATNTGLASAIPWLGGCTSSFVSPDGLIITNHHCAFGAVQMNSTPAHDYITDGFLAAGRAEELPARAQRVYVFKGYDDVTAKVRSAIAADAPPAQRIKALEAREKELVAGCEKSGLRCRVAEMYGGKSFYMFRQLEIRDVRLVYAPARAIGEFGGEVDNWMWPRHTGDYSFFRAYVGPDGKPADYSPANVPYKPDRFLKLAPAGVKDGDFTMIIGYPGRTMRYRIAALVAQDTEFGYPYQIKLLSDWMAVLDERAKTGKAVEIKVASAVKGLANAMKKYEGMVEGLTKEDLAGQRRVEEAKLQAWIDADPARKAKWGDVLPALDAQAARGATTRERDILVRYLPRAGSLLPAALTIVRWSQQSGKPDVDRDLGYQARDERTIRMRLTTMQRNLDLPTDRAVLTYFFRRAAALPAGQRLASLDAALAATGETGDAAVAALLDEILGKTSLTDEKTRLGLLGLDEAAVAAKHDPLLGFAIALRRDMQAIEDERKTEEGVLIELTPRYVDALAAFRGTPLYPDANSTIRFTDATVKGYSPRDGVYNEPFTTLPGVIAKCTGVEPFNCPKRLVAAYDKGAFGPYVAAPLGAVPACFLSTNDITGGNSGSPIMNGKGELVGLAFDGDYESMTSDYRFSNRLSRTINVDIRYVLWCMDYVDNAHALMREMGVEPSNK